MKTSSNAPKLPGISFACIPLAMAVALLCPLGAFATENFVEAANKELILPANQRSSHILSTPATVRPQVDPVASPVTYKALHLGVSVFSYRPEGQARVSNLEPFDLGSVGAHAFPSLEFRWQPYEVAHVPRLFIGGFASLGYAVRDVQLRAPTGEVLPETKLHTLKGGGGLSATYLLTADGRWSFGSLFGVGYLNSVRASRSSFANSTSGLPFFSVSGLVQRRLARKWFAYLGVETRQPLRPEKAELQLPRESLVVGLLGSLR